MRLRAARLGVLIACVMGLMATSTPAEATWVKNVTLLGNVALTGCQGVGTPGVNGVPDVKTEPKIGPKGVPELNTTVLNGNTCDFTLNAQCAKTSLGNGKKLGEDLCVIFAKGTVTGFCGLSSGTGLAHLINLTNPTKPAVYTDFKFSSTATTIRVSGGNDTKWVRGVVTVTPVTGSCAAKTATGFLVQGDVTFKQIT